MAYRVRVHVGVVVNAGVCVWQVGGVSVTWLTSLCPNARPGGWLAECSSSSRQRSAM